MVMIKRYFEAVLLREELGDFEVKEYPTLPHARKGLKVMIAGKPYFDAYIREFRYTYNPDNPEERWDAEQVKDYEVKK